MKNRANITDRKILKNLFSKGSLPTDNHFEKLIDSTFNKVDDKIDINEEDGLMIYPANKGELLSFFEDNDDENAKWIIKVAKDDGLIIKELNDRNTLQEVTKDKEATPSLFLQKGGNIGIRTNQPHHTLDVNGMIASHGRIGNYQEGTLEADGTWQNIFVDHLNESHAYEVTAYVEGKKGEGKYALLHATAVSTYGNSKPKITKTGARFGKRANALGIRWESRPTRLKLGKRNNQERSNESIWSKFISFWESKNTFEYNLQLRTKSNYGTGVKIYYKVAIVWSMDFVKPLMSTP